MGASFCVVFESQVPPRGAIGSDHVALVPVKERLDKIAQVNRLRPLGDFESYDPADLAEYLDGDSEEVNLPAVQWFPPIEGLTAVRGLAEYLRSHPEIVSRQADVLTDLAGIEEELASAASTGVRFRFAVVL